jgi:hypothetical protein
MNQVNSEFIVTNTKFEVKHKGFAHLLGNVSNKEHLVQRST